MMRGNDTINYENRTSPNQNLTFRYITSVIKKRNPELNEIIARERGLVNDEGLFTNLALLLSDQCAHTVKIAIFQGNNKRSIKGQKEIGGSVIKQIVMTYKLLENFNGEKDVYTANGAVRRKDFPMVAVKEAVTNAIVHRDYCLSGSTLINVFDNRLEVLSLGGIAPKLSAEAIQMGISQSRNEGLAKIMADLKIMLNYGTGFSKIKSAYVGEKIVPEIVTTLGAFKVVLPNINYGIDRGVRVKREEPVQSKAEIEEKFKTALAAALADRDDGTSGDGLTEAEIYDDEDESAFMMFDSHDDDYNENIQYEKIITYIEEHGSIKRKEAQLVLGVGQSRALAVLGSMQEDGLIKPAGVGRNTEYRKIDRI